jgi:hypothetical protein
MIQPINGAEALYTNTLAAHRVRAVRSAEDRIEGERPWKRHDQAYRDVVAMVGPVFKDRNQGLTEWAEMLAREVLAGNPVPAVDRLVDNDGKGATDGLPPRAVAAGEATLHTEDQPEEGSDREPKPLPDPLVTADARHGVEVDWQNPAVPGKAKKTRRHLAAG